MKICQINTFYNYGSTGKIVKDLHDASISKGFDSIVIYGRGERIYRTQNIKKVSYNCFCKISSLFNRMGTLQYGGALISTYKIKKILEKEKPDIVHLHCLNGNFVNIYKLLNYLKINKIFVILTLHAEFMYTGNCAHSYNCIKYNFGCGSCCNLYESTKSIFFDRTHLSWKKMKEAFKNFDNMVVITMTPFFKKRAMKSEILKNVKHKLISNGVDTNFFYYRKQLDKKNYLLYITAEFSINRAHPKGGYYIVELAKKMPQTKIVVVGKKDDTIKTLPNNIEYIGEIKDRNILAEIYSKASITIITSKRETFSMICAESLCCGTPVVGFKSGGPESISIKEYSSFVEYEDLNELKKEIKSMMKKNFSHEKISKIALKIYPKEKMISDYFELYQEIMKNKNI